ncbi:amino acid transporter [Microbacterium sp. 4R-513]|uniref:amino acid transporter n=1 Tax=Microbacterium sp. 4R-513 TaxID=2567934 RepID=UPI0013E11FE1|nr:amino acid transporter [Microbacterium sp. 4R-513]QIG39014.1 amino acid transporter [Microbacterium sp. 4R-513]
MSADKPTRRDLMKPVQLLGLAFGAALFTGIVTLVSMGFFQQKPGDELQRALVVAAIAAGVAFIAVLLIVSLLLLAVDPAQVQKTVDRPVLLPEDEQHDGDGRPDAAASGDDKR